jgi:hypothetical protein
VISRPEIARNETLKDSLLFGQARSDGKLESGIFSGFRVLAVSFGIYLA